MFYEIYLFIIYQLFIYLLSEVIRAEAETCFPHMKMQINFPMLLLSLLTINLVHIKEETIQTTKFYEKIRKVTTNCRASAVLVTENIC